MTPSPQSGVVGQEQVTGAQHTPEAFECLIHDADCPSMTARFRVPEGFPLAGGVYRIERIRTATPEDTARWSRFREPMDEYELLDALEAMVLNDRHKYRDCHKAAVAAIAKARGQ